MRGGRYVSRGHRDPSTVSAALWPKREHFAIDADAVGSYRLLLGEMAEGFPAAEAAVQRFSDWQVVLAIESLWAAAKSVG